ncbi:MAG: tetratricopeptide repeat protein, partial [Sphingomonas sp.]|uniref:tetratricopeptide repeat protein n=3 Tax=unclassified Sphingomonas TaxID=196159 RepID=UPI001ACFCE5C
MIEGPASYPLLRRRRRRTRRARLTAWARVLRLGAAGIGSLAVVFGIIAIARHAAAPDPHAEAKAAAAAFATGNYSAARHHAETALAVSPDRLDTLLLLARADLALGEGEAAEGALNRALRTGADRAVIRPLLADAWLRQGETA